jgi:hypothetical protein
MIRVGDLVVTKTPLYWLGENIGDRLGRVLDTSSYVIIELFDFHSNPVKCFTYELEVIDDVVDEINDQDLTEFFQGMDAKLP